MVPKSVRRENLNIFKLHFWAVSFRSFLFLNNRVIFRASSSPDKHAAGLKVCEFFGVIILGTFGPCEVPQISNVCKTLSSCFRGHIQIHFFPSWLTLVAAAPASLNIVNLFKFMQPMSFRLPRELIIIWEEGTIRQKGFFRCTKWSPPHFSPKNTQQQQRQRGKNESWMDIIVTLRHKAPTVILQVTPGRVIHR